MPYLQQVSDWLDGQPILFQLNCDDDVNQVYQEIEDEWQPNNRFTIPELLRESFPDFMLYLQKQIDDECEDDTETITFPPERDERDEAIQEEILDTQIKLLEARKELLEVKITELEESRGGVFDGIKRFIRNIFRG